jgi:hypothetical protein
MVSRRILAVAGVIGVAALVALPVATSAGGSFIGAFSTVSQLRSTVPANGDVNPYGTFVVPHTAGNLVAGDILVSNFNNAMNEQGTGTTVVELTPSGSLSPFAQIDPAHLPGSCPGGVGLTTALVVLPDNYVVVGSLPTADGSAPTGAGCLLVLNSTGGVIRTLSGKDINGPWDMTVATAKNRTALFFTNVLNGTVAAAGATVNRGTVVRIDVDTRGSGAPTFHKPVVIGSGFGERTDPSALVVGPTGVGVGGDGTLYVADSLNNRIAAIPDAFKRNRSAGSGLDVSSNGALNDPLGLTMAPNGDILTVNGGDGNIVETTPEGSQVATTLLDGSGNPPGAGALFGLAVVPDGSGVYFVDDATNTLDLLGH